MKRFVSLVLTVLMLTSCLSSLSASAADYEHEYEGGSVGRPGFEAYNEAAVLALEYTEEGMKEYLLQEIRQCNTTINISAYNIAVSEANFLSLANLIMYGIPEAFHVNNISCKNNGRIITKLTLTYDCDAQTYDLMMSETEKIAESLVQDIQGADLSDAEKALLIHDRLAVHCTYDDNFLSNDTALCESYSIYGALVEGQAICQGYARAYMYLLDFVGVESYICTSDTLNHMWNIVYVDGLPYHVDVTWDDPSFGDNSYNVAGYVEHIYFLQSTDAFYSGGHTATDYDAAPADTTYDNYCWQNSTTSFQLLDGKLYYVDNRNSKLMSFSDEKELLDVSHKWKATGINYYNDNFTSLACDGETLLFSDSNSIYSYDVANGEKQKVYTAETDADNLIFIYGIKYSDNLLIYDLSDSPSFDNSDSISRHTVQYDKTAPQVSAKVTNVPATYQTLRLSFSDNTGICGYYFGKSSVYTDNIFVATDETTADITIVESGTYYIVAKDDFGNLSKVFRVDFCKTTLDPAGGTVIPGYIISCSGFEISLPVPEKQSAEFLGWSAEAEGTDVVSEITPVSDSTYYAVWNSIVQKVPVSAEIASLPLKTQYYEGESLELQGLSVKVIMSDGSEEFVTEGIAVTGFDPYATGTQTLTAELYGFSLGFEVNVVKVEPVSLEVKTLPEKTSYFAGDTVDTTGLELMLGYNNGLSVSVTEGYNVENPLLTEAGEAEIRVEYSGFVASFAVQVAEVTVSAVDVAELPEKTEYYMGEQLDTTGLVLVLTYSNGTFAITDSGYTVYGYDPGVEGEQTVTVDVDGVTADFTVNVKKPKVISAEIISLPQKTEYKVGEKLDLTGIKIKVTYDSGYEQIYSDNYIAVDTAFTQVGENIMTLRFDECSVQLEVYVTENTIAFDPAETVIPTIVPVIPPSSEPVEETTDATEQTEATEYTEPIESTASADEPTSVATEASEATEHQENTSASTAAPTEFLAGDANCDGKVNIKDATAIQKFVAKLSKLEALGQQAADVNFDGKINVKDVTTIQKFVAGIIKKFE